MWHPAPCGGAAPSARLLCVSILTWSTYLLSAMLWLWFGIRQRDKNIYLPCVGWIALDGAVIVGAVVYR